ncbi:uncharacterized protein Z518_02223 [Rhinocladiella mackenziei CBS 650.93]|uniref:BZIP transcription factor n=1 Tax=Rhinocladiella mackenziei CBS 650.93 TaxID=1442369 RepID=A0A0D2JEH5_9EURO|nr:uncharacterized protein Z518_02223 [Rhinocladiella mackenziei CBS 650.93]KIX07570.1 hypothetical protein Z518_02223 [Rhinocladiella mackenziei CBS 650.93]
MIRRPPKDGRNSSPRRNLSRSATAPVGQRPQYPPDDARAMSPRRNNRELEVLETNIRKTLKRQADRFQSSLTALTEKMNKVKLNHEELEKQNQLLGEYISHLGQRVAEANPHLQRSVVAPGSKKEGET